MRFHPPKGSFSIPKNRSRERLAGELGGDHGTRVVYDDLNEYLAQDALCFLPGISWTISGMVATNASGFNVVRYGETRDHVHCLAVVIANGAVLEEFGVHRSHQAVF